MTDKFMDYCWGELFNFGIAANHGKAGNLAHHGETFAAFAFGLSHGQDFLAVVFDIPD